MNARAARMRPCLWRQRLALLAVAWGTTAAAVADDLVAPVSLDVPAATAAAEQSPASVSRGRTPLGDWPVLAALGSAFVLLAGYSAFARRRVVALPPDVFEVLGSAPLAGPHAVRIVRFGPKTLLLGVSPRGAATLAEITDPQATAAIAAACRGTQRPVIRPVVRTAGCVLAAVALAASGGVGPVAAHAAESEAAVAPAPPESAAAAAPEGIGSLLGTRAVESLLPSALAIGVMSLAPAVLLMTTCFVRMSVVLALLRQGLGAPQIPSNQILASLAIFLSAMVMWPVWKQAWRDGVEPCRQGTLAPAEAFEKGSLPVRRWMAAQIEQAGNRDTMLLFLERHPEGPRRVATYDDVPVETLLPAFLVSELETAFAIGFRLLLPFLVLDILVATLVVSTGLVMLPPTLVALPLKLMVFVAADGWTLVIRSLLDGVRAAAS